MYDSMKDSDKLREKLILRKYLYRSIDPWQIKWQKLIARSTESRKCQSDHIFFFIAFSEKISFHRLIDSLEIYRITGSSRIHSNSPTYEQYGLHLEMVDFVKKPLMLIIINVKLILQKG